MNKHKVFALVAALSILVACGRQSGPLAISQQDERPPVVENSLVVLGEDLQQLKDDFNANVGKARLLFLSGPTCGICLRGMADLNDEFIAASQNDDRLVTFVVHVPTLGAQEVHVADTIPLLRGPRVHHYWEESGIIGIHYKEVMDVNMYVWDFWAIYGPEARWQETLPPKPDYYEHQLGGWLGDRGGFPRERVLDAERFAAQARKTIDQVDSGGLPSPADHDVDGSNLLADGTSIPVVAQPRNVAVSQYIRNRGGYENLKRIQTVEMQGSLEVDGRSYPLSISMARPDKMRRVLTVADQVSVADISTENQLRLDPTVDHGLPSALESRLLETFEFDGRLIEWPDKGHQLSMQGMQKIGDVLAWKLDFIQSSGQHWHLFINSHGGDLVMANMLDENDQLEYSIIQSDFRETSGFKFPYRIEYVDRDGQSLGVEVLDDVLIVQQMFDLAAETVVH
jgi:hypothetical protein